MSAEVLINNAYVHTFIKAFLGIILLAASITKLGNFRKFAEIVDTYQLLPARTVRAVSLFLLLTEFLLGGCLLTGRIPLWAALGAMSVFSLFAGAVAVNLLRGRREIACGCFGASSDQRLSWFIVIRNLALAACASFLAVAQLNSSSWGFSSLKLTLSARETFATASFTVAVISVWWLIGTLLRITHSTE